MVGSWTFRYLAALEQIIEIYPEFPSIGNAKTYKLITVNNLRAIGHLLARFPIGWGSILVNGASSLVDTRHACK